MVGEQPREFELRPAQTAGGDGFGVERRFEILERQRVLQNGDVLLLRGAGFRQLRQHAREEARADDRSAADRGLAEKVGTGVAVDGRFGLAHGTVDVDDGQIEMSVQERLLLKNPRRLPGT